MSMQGLDIILHLWLVLCLAIIITAIPHIFNKNNYQPLSKLEKSIFILAVVKSIFVIVILEFFFGGIF